MTSGGNTPRFFAPYSRAGAVPSLRATCAAEILVSKPSFARQTALRAIAPLKFEQDVAEVFGREVRPALGEKEEFGEGTFPEKKVREALLAAGADQQVHVRGAAALHFGEHVAEGLAGKIGDFIELAGGLKDGMSSGIINRQAQMQRLAV